MTDTATPTTAFELLHATRIKGLATDSVLAGMTGVPVESLPEATTPLVEAGLMVRREGRFGGFSLTQAGKAEAARLLTADSETHAAQVQLAELYQEFLPVNGDFKRLCQRWQMRGEVPNDHQDAAYDAGVVTDLRELDGGWPRRLAGFADTLPRIARYAARLTAALERLEAGDTGAFARPMYDSYHDIWMELHEELIVSRGLTRGAHDEG